MGFVSVLSTVSIAPKYRVRFICCAGFGTRVESPQFYQVRA